MYELNVTVISLATKLSKDSDFTIIMIMKLLYSDSGKHWTNWKQSPVLTM